MVSITDKFYKWANTRRLPSNENNLVVQVFVFIFWVVHEGQTVYKEGHNEKSV